MICTRISFFANELELLSFPLAAVTLRRKTGVVTSLSLPGPHLVVTTQPLQFAGAILSTPRSDSHGVSSSPCPYSLVLSRPFFFLELQSLPIIRYSPREVSLALGNYRGSTASQHMFVFSGDV